MPIQLSGSGSITGVSTLRSLASLDVTGSVSVGGTLIYDDVTNIDSLGIVTARSDVHIGAGLSVTGISTFNAYLDINGDINIDGSQITYTSSSNQLKFADDAQLRFGGGNDLRIYHSSGASFIQDAGSGSLFVETDGGGIRLRKIAGSENLANFYADGAVELYYNNSKKFETTNTGAVVTGILTASGTGGGAATLGSHLDLGDNQKVRFGASDDLDMYHDGTDSYIRNNTGQLLIRGNDIKLNNYLGTQTHAEFTDGGLTTGAIDLSAISSSISDTAVDIFVYDTRKDSDGGAWRKRTQHTSWYNETLNTATRGSRREFPAVAVIVAENTSITIYDGDDPDLPMWMVFNTVNGMIFTNANNLKSVSMLNGILVWTSFRSGIISFIPESAELLEAAYAYGLRYGLVNRNISGGWNTVTGRKIVNNSGNDIAMTVLPNAPIDDATGLPIPTIAVATDGGVSVIRDDGTVYDVIDSNGARKCYDVSFTKDHKIMHTGDLGAGSTHAGNVFVTNILTSDRAEYDNHSDLYRWYSTFQYYPRINGGNTFNTRVLDPIDVGGHHYAMADVGVSLIEDGTSTFAGNTNGMVAYITSDYNSGYQHGDIKGAFLSDTDTTNVSASTNLVTNGTFDSNNDSWNGSGISLLHNSFTTSQSSGYLIVNSNTNSTSYYGISQDVTTTTGTEYMLSFDIVSGGTGNGAVRVSDGNTATNVLSTVGGLGVGSYSFRFTSGGQSFSKVFLGRDPTTNSGTNATVYYDNIVVREATEEDRSVNNKGLQVFGTVTKSAVATGAELVGYSGNGTSNYLEQPYNSDLDFGANSEFSVMGWMYNEYIGGGQYIFDRSVTYGTSRDWQLWVAADLKYMAMYIDGGQAVVTPNNSYPNNAWFQFVVVRTGGHAKIYINGVEKASAASTLSTIPASNVPMKVLFNCNPNTKLSLFRISSSVPSLEQIKKMYEDEKVLFQENAKATLYGSSDAVTALGYDEDTELLHVGTSAGRSDFQGLRRINNTTTAVTTAISASDDLIAEQ